MRTSTIRFAVAIVTATTATAVLAQPGGGGQDAPIELPPERLIPAEQTIDPEYGAPLTSWGDPLIAGHWSTDDMRGVSGQRPEAYGEQEYLSDEDFLARAQSQQRGRSSAVETETFLRNEWGTRTFGFSSLVVDPPNGQQPGVTEAGAALRAANQSGSTNRGPFHEFNDFSMYDRCISLGIGSGMRALIYGNGIKIAQSPDAVTITYEMVHDTRVIPLDDRPHLPPIIKQYTGNGRGFWDGDTLVIETMGFHPKVGVGAATPSDQMKTVERIRRVDGEMLEYRITIDDPVSLEHPYTLRAMWTTQPDYYVWEYSCHEGNGAVGHSLSGERTWERQVAEAVAAGQEPPGRSGSVYGPPGADAEIFNINEGN